MESKLLLVPDYQIFETCHLSRKNGDSENPTVIFFKKAWTHRIDFREKIICISKELNQELVEKRYKSEKKKKQALFSVVRIHDADFDCESTSAQIKLATILSVEEDRDVYYVTDNPNLTSILESFNIKTITSTKATELIEKESKEFNEDVGDITKANSIYG